jgi:hypothetical protein
MEQICSICLDNNDNELIKTPCNHYFHKDCINEIKRPTCPLCKKNIFKFLIKNGISKKEIFNRIQIDDYRIMYDSITTSDNYGEKDSDDLIIISILAKKININWKEVYTKIMLDIIMYKADLFWQFSNNQYNNDKNGFFMIYCDLSVFLLNIVNGYTGSIINWIKAEKFNQTKKIKNFCKYIDKNKNDEFGFVISFDDDIDRTGIYYSTHYISKKSSDQCPTTISILKSVCESSIKKLEYSKNIKHIEVETITDRLKYIINGKYSIIKWEKTFDSVKSFLKNEIENLVKDNKIINADLILIVDYEDCYKYKIIKKNNGIFFSPFGRYKILGDCGFVNNFINKKLKSSLNITVRLFSNEGFELIYQYISRKNIKDIDIAKLNKVESFYLSNNIKLKSILCPVNEIYCD